MAEAKKVLHAYVVVSNVDGSVDVFDYTEVTPEMVEGAEKISTPEIYENIAKVADLIELQKVRDVAAQGAYIGAAKALEALFSKATEAESTEETK